jgi:hypothetical protein
MSKCPKCGSSNYWPVIENKDGMKRCTHYWCEDCNFKQATPIPGMAKNFEGKLNRLMPKRKIIQITHTDSPYYPDASVDDIVADASGGEIIVRLDNAKHAVNIMKIDSSPNSVIVEPPPETLRYQADGFSYD